MNRSTKGLGVAIGAIGYRNAWQLQSDIVAAKNSGRLNEDVVLMLEHPPVYTIGKKKTRKHLLISQAQLDRHRIEVVSVERGGDITFHGPGQLVVYMILNLRGLSLSVRDLVHRMEEVMLRTASEYGVPARRWDRNPGIWVAEKKMGSLGIAIRHGVSFHGFALNVTNDLQPFEWIEPCGLKNIAMTSLAEESAVEIRFGSVTHILRHHLEQVMDMPLTFIRLSELRNRLKETMLAMDSE